MILMTAIYIAGIISGIILVAIAAAGWIAKAKKELGQRNYVGRHRGDDHEAPRLAGPSPLARDVPHSDSSGHSPIARAA